MLEEHEITLALNSAFNVLRPTRLAIETWTNALRSGDYKFGYGVLRDADDRYDAFGVLAATHFVDWTWDTDEGAWAVEGSVDFLPPALIVKFLDCGETNSFREGWATKISNLVVKLGDGASGFELVARVILRAFADHEAGEDRRQNEWRSPRPYEDAYTRGLPSPRRDSFPAYKLGGNR